VNFRPDTVRGASATSGTIDFRLARRHLVAEYHRGRLSRLDVCDAHPELLRAATNLGQPVDESCPICEEESLVHVSYVFGGRLPASGRCIATIKELTKLSRQYDELACYVVEVCPSCRWNHLARTFQLGRAHAR
jgi:Family of unknown function (DUF5318)